MKNKNILSVLFDYIHVKYNRFYLDKIYDTHPYRDSFFCLSEILNKYSVKNEVFEVDQKETDLFLLPTPFISLIVNDFILVTKVEKGKVSCLINGKITEISLDSFISMWTGVALIVTKTDKSIEPEYHINKNKEFISKASTILLISLVILVLLMFVLNSFEYFDFWFFLLLAVNAIGIFISILLVKKQFYLQSSSADRICSLFKKVDCDAVLESGASKLFGVFGWSEVGLSYFISNIIIIFALPQFIYLLALVNICVLPYSFWSLWYQKIRIKQWCPLCLIVQGLLYTLFLINFLADFIKLPNLSTFDITSIICLYFIPFLIVRLIIPIIFKSSQFDEIQFELNKIKISEDIFKLLLKQQLSFEIDKSDSKILFGNPNAKNTITILSNPYCGRCAKLHKKVEELLSKINNLICVQYIFTSYKDNEDNILFFLISIYLSNPHNNKISIYSEWYEKGKHNIKSFREKYEKDIDKKVVMNEYQKHRAWVLKNKNLLSGTPTVFFNGYKVPDIYEIEDLVSFADLDVNTK